MATISASRQSLTKPILLVVDDLEANLEAMRATLDDDPNWQLRCAASGEAALRCMLTEDVSLVLLDVQMPGMDGYEVAELMRGNPKTRHTPIIFVSAIARTQELILRGYSNGAMDFILKPFDPSVLRHKVHNLLSYENNRRELMHMGMQLERERAFNESILTHAAEGILVIDENGCIQYANPPMAEFIGSSPAALHGREFCELIAQPDSEKSWLESGLYRHWKNRQIYRLLEAELQCLKGTLPVAISSAPLPYPQRAMVVLVRDISSERELRQKLESLIVTDPLTGLLNRRGFYLAVEAALARAQRGTSHLALIYLDLDGFKRINDSLGHAVGDELLCRVGKQLKTGLRSYDVLARLGGDEFTILLDGLDNCRDAGRVAGKLMKKIAVPHGIEGEELSISASAGIACYPQAGKDTESLLRAADMAMYEAKQNGRKRYHFHSPQMTERAHARLELEQRLHHAVEQEQFSLLYQPQFYLQSGKLRGFEALLRWTEGNSDNISPAQFIPLLEETYLINPLGQWIFQQGLDHLLKLREQFGNELLLSINVSPVQFAQGHLAEKLARRLQSRGIEPHQLEVEVTESTLMRDMDLTQKQIAELRDLGVKIAVDDFGTGYSSLAYLRQFDIDSLKIDRLFINNVLNSVRDAAVVNTIIDLAHHLGLEVIAEGVETEEQRGWLLEHDCSTLQGWLVAPALTLPAAMQVPPQVSWNEVPVSILI